MLFFLTLIVFFSQVNISAPFSYRKLQNSLMITIISINLIFLFPRTIHKSFYSYSWNLFGTSP